MGGMGMAMAMGAAKARGAAAAAAAVAAAGSLRPQLQMPRATMPAAGFLGAMDLLGGLSPTGTVWPPGGRVAKGRAKG